MSELCAGERSKENDDELRGKKMTDPLSPTVLYEKLEAERKRNEELEARLFNERERYDSLHETYCLAFDYIAELNKCKNTDEAMELFKIWVCKR